MVHIEADHANAMLLRHLMDLSGHYTLYQATDGRTGLELCLQLRPDLILTEMHLPDMNGHEMLQRLRAHAATRHTLCIVLSADAMNHTIEPALAAGFDDHRTKPIDVWQFLEKLRKALDRAQRLKQAPGVAIESQ